MISIKFFEIKNNSSKQCESSYYSSGTLRRIRDKVVSPTMTSSIVVLSPRKSRSSFFVNESLSFVAVVVDGCRRYFLDSRSVHSANLMSSSFSDCVFVLDLLLFDEVEDGPFVAVAVANLKSPSVRSSAAKRGTSSSRLEVCDSTGFARTFDTTTFTTSSIIPSGRYRCLSLDADCIHNKDFSRHLRY